MIREHDFTNSSMLAKCSFNDETEELKVIFGNGKSYTFENVSKDIYDNLINVGSAGKYFNSIKNSLTVKK